MPELDPASGHLKHIQEILDDIRQHVVTLQTEQKRGIESVEKGIELTHTGITAQTNALGQMEIVLRVAELKYLLEMLEEEKRLVSEWVDADLEGMKQITEVFDRHHRELEQKRSQRVYQLMQPAFRLYEDYAHTLVEHGRVGVEVENAVIDTNRDAMRSREAVVRSHVERAASAMFRFEAERIEVQKRTADLQHDLQSSATGDLCAIPFYVVRVRDRSSGDVRFTVVPPSTLTPTSDSPTGNALAEMAEFKPQAKTVLKAVQSWRNPEGLFDGDKKRSCQPAEGLDSGLRTGAQQRAFRQMSERMKSREVTLFTLAGKGQSGGLVVPPAPIAPAEPGAGAAAPALATAPGSTDPIPAATPTAEAPSASAAPELAGQAILPAEVQAACDRMVDGDLQAARTMLGQLIAQGRHVDEATVYLEQCQILEQDRAGGARNGGGEA